MAVRIAALCTIVLVAAVLVATCGVYFAARQVRPFYEEALQVAPVVSKERSRELESRATALYSDAQRAGRWQALFTSEQINGWLATQMAGIGADELAGDIRDPRVAITPDLVTLGFRTSSGGVETVASVDASIFITEDGDVAIRLLTVRAGVLRLPTLQLADELAAACRKLSWPVRWAQQGGYPVAIVELHGASGADKRDFFIDSIELGTGDLFVVGHTALRGGDSEIELSDYELKLTPNGADSALEIARRPQSNSTDDE
jgi:hypothetical protein